MQRTIVNPIYKDTVTFIETSAETGGAYSLIELTLLPGGNNPPHMHTAFTETFTAIEGQLGLQLKTGRKLLNPGESYTVSKREVHNFFNAGNEEIKYRIRFIPGNPGMEAALCIAYGLATDGHTDKKGMPKSLLAAGLLMEMSNSYPAGFMSVIKPLFSFLARSARKNGLQHALIQKYCSPLKGVSTGLYAAVNG